MSVVAFVTCEDVPSLADDDRMTADVLFTRGVTVQAVRWDAPGIGWAAFAAVVIRSTWDYHLRPDRYRRWLRDRAADGTNLWNPPRAVLANVHKGYLSALEARGIPVVPTVHLPAAPGRVLRDVLEARGYDDVVIKPAVSANARGTWRASRASAGADRDRFEAQSRAEDLLVQPFLREVAGEGEWSLMFFRGAFSHAVRKQPPIGEFRVQEQYGGGAIAADPPASLVEQARAVLAAAGDDLLYARVDGIRRGDDFLLMELEINEPTLFLAMSPGAPVRFADAVMGVMKGKG